MEITVHSTQELKNLAQQIVKDLPPAAVVALVGDLGAGKTTFVSYAVEALGLDARVQSPTFVLNRIYADSHRKVNHYDLYRVSTAQEVLDLGILEELDYSTATFIEWPEIIMDKLPKERLYIMTIEMLDDDSRKVTFEKVAK